MASENVENQDDVRAEKVAAEVLHYGDRVREALKEYRHDFAKEVEGEIVQAIRTAKSQTTEKETQIRAALDEQQRERVPALSAIRTQIADLGHQRYRGLPAWQREFRTPDGDHAIREYFVALKNNDIGRIRQLCDQWQRAVGTVGTSTAGGPFSGTMGDVIPLPMTQYVNETRYRMARMRQHVRVFSDSVAGNLRVPIQGTASGSNWIAENAAITEAIPGIASNLHLVLQKHSNISSISNETLEDSPFAVVQWLVNDVGMRMAENEDAALYSTGTGAASDQPRGFELADTTVAGAPAYYVKTVAQAADNTIVSAIDYKHIVKMYYLLHEAERRNAIWSCGDVVAMYLSQIVDGTGRPIFRIATAEAGLISDEIAAPGQTAFMLGRPVVNMPGLSDTGATPSQNENRLYFWNPMRSYAMLERPGMRVEVSRDDLFTTDVTQFKFVTRLDGGVIGNFITTRPQYVYTGSINAPA